MSVQRIKINVNATSVFDIVYKLGDEEILTEGRQGYDMMQMYVSRLFARNVTKRDFTYHPMRSVFCVEIPYEDKMLFEMIRNVSHDLLWTNMEFMDSFRQRLIFYNLYYDIEQKQV